MAMTRYHSYWNTELVFLSLGLSMLGALTGGELLLGNCTGPAVATDHRASTHCLRVSSAADNRCRWGCSVKTSHADGSGMLTRR